MSSITLIPCGGKKADTSAGPIQAQSLYVGTMFLMGRKAAEKLGNPWMIVSAKHGLVDPKKKVKTYDLKMGDPGSIEVAQLAKQLAALHKKGITELYCLLPKEYLAKITTAIRLLRSNNIIIVVINGYDACVGRRGIGCQKHTLKNIIEGK